MSIPPAVPLALIISLGAGAATAQRPVSAAEVQAGTLSFDGKATAGDFVGTTSTVTGHIDAASDLALVRGWVAAPVRTLVSGNDHRDRDLNKSMESDKYPEIRFDLTGVTPGEASGDSVPVTLEGTLHVHGVERPVTMPGSVVLRGGGAQMRGSFPLNLKEYKIGGLSKFFGFFKMSPDIVVHVDVTFSARS